MPSKFQVGFRLHQQPFRISILVLSLINVKTSFFSKSIVSHVSVGVALTGFNKSSKYSLQHERISLSSLRMFPVESLMEVVVLNFSHAISKWFAKILCLPMNSWNPTDDQIPPKSVFSTFLLPELQIFALLNTGITNQIMTCFATRSQTHLSLLGWLL